jgi:hypothetical protein
MDRSAVQRRLALTEEQIASGQRLITEQLETVSLLERSGRAADHAKYVLAGLLRLQAARREDRDRFLKELDELKMKH